MLSLRRHFALVLILLSTNLLAQTPTPAEAASIKSIIETQLAAFTADDAEAAYAVASDAIREKFGDARTFLNMVKGAYPVVYRPLSVTFLAPERMGDGFGQRVQFADHDNQLWLALYAVIRLPDGSWRINGCVMQKLEGSPT